MSSYQERLDAFAEGKRLARMSRPLRNRADAWCDACGSVQARVLFGVKDERTQRVYFVGEHCLQQLAERGAVVRRFCKQSAEEAYAARFDRRDATTPTGAAAGSGAPSAADPSVRAAEGTGGLTAYLVIAPADGTQPGSRARIVPLRLDDSSMDSVRNLIQESSNAGAPVGGPTGPVLAQAGERTQESAATADAPTEPVTIMDGQGVGRSAIPTPAKDRVRGKRQAAPANDS